jgi:hypothetical protein
MKITNNFGLPAPLVRAVSASKYDKGDADFSVTELLKPPRMRALEIKHADDLEEDANERLWALMGSAGHEVLRRSADGGIVEERVTIDLGGVKVSGQADYVVTDMELIDYKFTSIYAIKDGVKPEWEQQLNCYNYMCRQYGVAVKGLKIVAILRDWSKPESRRDKEYPQAQAVVLPVRMWDCHVTRDWMLQRINLHKSAQLGQIPDCTPEEMWEKPGKYAVMKGENQRASRVLDTKLEAGEWMAAQPKPSQFHIEIRPSQRNRCEAYCPASRFCSQFREWKLQQGRTD